MSMPARSADSPAHRPITRAVLGALLLVALGAAVAHATVEQKGNLRVKVTGKISPRSLPRTGVAPIAVSVGGQVSTTDSTIPPELKLLTIEINRNGRLDYQGLPVCSTHQIQPADNARALAACRSSLVGEGTFSAYITLKGSEPAPTTGRLLVFNGRDHGKQVLLGHIYSDQPFATSFVIPFEVVSNRRGRFGTSLTANIAKALGSRRNLTGIEMTLSRHYSYHGARHSYVSAGCPAPKGVSVAGFPLVKTSFRFAGSKTLTATLNSSCKVRG